MIENKFLEKVFQIGKNNLSELRYSAFRPTAKLQFRNTVIGCENTVCLFEQSNLL